MRTATAVRNQTADAVMLVARRPMEQVWEVLTETEALGRWLGASRLAFNARFQAPAAPKIEGRVRSITTGITIDDQVSANWFTVEVTSACDIPHIFTIEFGPGVDALSTLISVSGDTIRTDPDRGKEWLTVLAAAVDLLPPLQDKTPRQAVVVIHGIGEQRPGATVSGMVGSLFDGVRSDGRTHFVSSPDDISIELEVNRFRLWAQHDDCTDCMACKDCKDCNDGKDCEGEKNCKVCKECNDCTERKNRKKRKEPIPETHFFEYYWADKIAGTTRWQVVRWIRRLLMHMPLRGPRHTLVKWLGTWVTLLAAVVAGALLLSGLRQGSVLPDWAYIASAIVLGLTAMTIDRVIRTTAGDAARYFGDSPHNVALRKSIRSDGVALLRKLHESGRYDRIVIVGHSLGSVVGYDLIRHFWVEVHKLHGSIPMPSDVALEAFQRALAETDETSPEWPELQWNLWKEMRFNGSPWLITDFVTLGSPLAHAAALMADSPADLDDRKQHRELLTAPPMPEFKPGYRSEDPSRPVIHYERTYQFGTETKPFKTLHSAAAFAPTRWTNLYYGGPHGDPVGGPLRGVFGDAIRDVRVSPGWRLNRWFLAAHLRYWHGDGLLKLRGALKLDLGDTLATLLTADRVAESGPRMS